MLSNYYTLTYIAATLKERLTGGIISQAFTQEKNELVISFEGGLPALVVYCQPQSATLYLHDRHARARRNSVDVLSGIVGRTVEDISVHPSDRVVSLHLLEGRAMHCLLFGSKPNVLLVDDQGIVLDAFLGAGSYNGPLELRPRDGGILDLTVLEQSLSEPAESVSRVLRRLYPTLGATLVHEVLHRAEIPVAAAAQSLDASTRERLQNALMGILTEVANPHPVVYVHAGEGEDPVAFSIIRLHHLEDVQPKHFGDVHEAVRFFLSRSRTHRKLDDQRSAVVASLRQQVEKIRRSVTAMESEERNEGRIREYERAANLLMRHHAVVARGKRVTLEDEQGTCEIVLDPRLTAIQNAQRYFEKVKSARTAQEQAMLRLRDLRRRVAAGERLLEELEAVTTQQHLKAFMQDNSADLDRFGLGDKAAKREQLPFRIFTVDGGFEVWAGKSSKNNDLLTMKYARPNDLWFHARGSSGSHVVLRVDGKNSEPGKRAKEQAASIAAYYSKMKNASMVPVAYTLKKYVRKPKGAPPGTVVIEREKVIFAEPGLPEGSPAAEAHGS